MRFFKALLLTFTFFSVIVFGVWKWIQSEQVRDADFTTYEISVDNRIRRYSVKIPNEQNQKWPVVLGFHGGRALNGLDFDRRSSLSRVLKENQILVVLPEGIRSYWNDGAGGRREDKSIDDVKFIRVLIQKITEDFPVDPNQFFAVGYSRGGTFSMRLSCELSELLAGIVAVGASLPAPLHDKCHFQKPVSLLLIHGTQDPVSPYEGGRIGINWFFLGRHAGTEMGVDATLSFWRDQLNCKQQEVSELEPVVQDGTRVKRIYDFGCDRNAFIDFYRVEGMGHVWPPFPRDFSFFMGKTSQNLDANAKVLDFIKSTH